MLNEYEDKEFYIVRKNARRTRAAGGSGAAGGASTNADEDDENEEDARLRHQVSVLDAPVYKEYHGVYIITNKISRSKVEVMLGINEERLEVYPKDGDYGGSGSGMVGGRIFRRQKSASYAMDTLVACDILEKRRADGERWSFRVVHLTTEQDYKKLDFEAEAGMAIEIHSKLSHLIDWQPSKTREDYLAYKEKKRQRRQTWQIGGSYKK